MRSKSVPLPPLPHSAEAERAVLGAILLADSTPNPALKTATEELHIGDFFLPQNQRIFSRMLDLDASRQPIELVTLVERLQAAGELDAAGGAPYIAQLVDGMPRTSNVRHYSLIVCEKATRRRIIHAGQQITETALLPTATWEDICQQLQALSKIVARSLQAGGPPAVTAEAFLMSRVAEGHY